MQAHVEIGEAQTFELRHAILVYTGSHRAFATVHDVIRQAEGPPSIGPAHPLTIGFVRELARGLGSQEKLEILPGNVLARSSEMIAWWSPASRRNMFFAEADCKARKLNGQTFPHPALVFKVWGGRLFVRALGKDTRPEASTPLKTAPYWNVAGDDGRVCLGTAPAPGDCSTASITAWEQAFHRSEFTHVLGPVRLTSHPGGFLGLWRSLAGKKRFPVRYLTDAGESLEEFVTRES